MREREREKPRPRGWFCFLFLLVILLFIVVVDSTANKEKSISAKRNRQEIFAFFVANDSTKYTMMLFFDLIVYTSLSPQDVLEEEHDFDVTFD